MLAAAGAFPNVEGSTPITVTADTPILNMLKPFTKTALADRLRNPVYSIIIFNELYFDVLLDKK